MEVNVSDLSIREALIVVEAKMAIKTVERLAVAAEDAEVSDEDIYELWGAVSDVQRATQELENDAFRELMQEKADELEETVQTVSDKRGVKNDSG